MFLSKTLYLFLFRLNSCKTYIHDWFAKETISSDIFRANCFWKWLLMDNFTLINVKLVYKEHSIITSWCGSFLFIIIIFKINFYAPHSLTNSALFILLYINIWCSVLLYNKKFPVQNCMKKIFISLLKKICAKNS